MSKTDFIDEGRRQGFLTAHKIVKQAAEEGKDPVAVLKAELDYRKITKIMIPVTQKGTRPCRAEIQGERGQLVRCARNGHAVGCIPFREGA